MATSTCPSPVLLADYVLGRCSAQDLEQVADHVDNCPACQARLETLDGVDDTFITKLRQPLPPDLPAEDEELEPLIARAAEIRVGDRGDAPDAEPPVALGQYELLGRCGRGGMGTVYKALHTRLKRLVAIKILPPQRLADPQAVARFQREMEAVGKLNHPNIVQAYDANEVDGQHFLAMEYLDGVNLSVLVRCGGALPIADACEIVRQAALGLQHAHDHDLVHRDVKPSNLMLTSAGTIKLLDLGLARLRPELPVDADITASGQVMGSADYMAPEQCLDARDVDARADVYSLGCTLFFLLAGRPPFAGRQYDTVGKKLLAHSQQTAPPIRELRPEIPAALATILGRMLAKVPGGRYATMDEVVEAVTSLATENNLTTLLSRRKIGPETGSDQGSEPPIACQPSRSHRRTRRWPWLIALFILFVPLVGYWRWNAVNFFLYGASGQSDDGASRAAATYLARVQIPEDVRSAVQTVLRQHPPIHVGQDVAA